MLVGCRMEYHIRMVGAHDPIDAAVVADGADQRHQIQFRMLAQQLLLDGVGVVLVDVEDHQPCRLGTGDLTAQLAADAAAAAGDQDGLAGKGFQDLLIIDLHLLTTQQVGDLHIAELGHTDFVIDQLV